MKLLYGHLSPFVRKVMIVAHEKGLVDRIELVVAGVHPFQSTDLVNSVNPLGKIPALMLEDGTALYGSTVIAEYLDASDGLPRFFPAGEARWPALRRNALADGILDAGVLARVEGLRPVERQWGEWRDVQLRKITHALDVAEGEAGLRASRAMTIGEVALICALGWLDFRFPDISWRTDRPALAAWFIQVSQRSAVALTAPDLSP
ncbi:MAG TPA: glutathione S-transferase N-terminal domain-containing protein [Sphingobium sp.]